MIIISVEICLCIPLRFLSARISKKKNEKIKNPNRLLPMYLYVIFSDDWCSYQIQPTSFARDLICCTVILEISVTFNAMYDIIILDVRTHRVNLFLITSLRFLWSRYVYHSYVTTTIHLRVHSAVIDRRDFLLRLQKSRQLIRKIVW